jgi:hypothetical protein
VALRREIQWERSGRPGEGSGSNASGELLFAAGISAVTGVLSSFGHTAETALLKGQLAVLARVISPSRVRVDIDAAHETEDHAGRKHGPTVLDLELRRGSFGWSLGRRPASDKKQEEQGHAPDTKGGGGFVVAKLRASI